ncbi:MAG: rRNA maturation RNase YbeY [Bacteroidota bacterium]
MAIHFFNEDTDFILPDTEGTSKWINKVLNEEKRQAKIINYIFCSDKHLLKLNQQYLNHETLTDIITFDNSELPDMLEADIFISVDRVKDNASQLNTVFDNELHRVMIHGLLHLIGYNDHTDDEKQVMRKKEDACLSLR